MELEGSEVVDDQVSLCGLVELELDNLWSALGDPEIGNFVDGLCRHVAGLVLADEELVGRNAYHQFHFRVKLRLSGRVKRYWTGRSGQHLGLESGRCGSCL